MTRKINPDLAVLKENWKGNLIINGQFQNETITNKIGFSDILKWRFSRNPQKEEKQKDTFQLEVQSINPFTMQENSIVWLGHASFLLNLKGIRLITDPCLFDLPSGRRKVELPCSADSLRSINYLLISHDHRDHFDKKSIEILIRNNPGMEALIPLNGSRLFISKTLNSIKMQEAGWYQDYNLKENIRIIFLPAKHWGRRGLNDFNKTLWGSFLLIANNTKIFFAGDTAYDEKLFKEIHNLFGDIHICLLPIGAYSPPYIMKSAHFNPEEAMQAFLDLGGKLFIPMHYGTYDLSDEPLGEPIARLQKQSTIMNISDRIKILRVGEELF
jgi:L-ascorbate metabolism protein UlaG (beta-lactamase superfamily)